MTEASPTYSEKDTYTKNELYAILCALDSRSRTDILYHCRTSAEAIEKEVKDEEGQDNSEASAHASCLRSMQSLAYRAEEDVKALG